MEVTTTRRKTLGRTGALALAVLAGFAATDAAIGKTATVPLPNRPIVRQMATLKIAATIPIGHTADWVAITSGRVWIGSTEPNAVNEIDPATSKVVTKIELPGRPCAGIAADDNSVWVPLCGPTPKLAKVDVKSHALDKVFDIGPVGGEQGIALGAGNVWLVTDKIGTLARIDPGTGAVVAKIALPPGSFNPVFSDGFVWVSRADDAELTVVDPATSSVSERIAVGKNPRFLTAGAGAIWTLNQGDGDLSRVDIAKRAPALSIPLHTPGPGGDVAYEPGRVWTTMMQTPLSAIDAGTSTVLCQWQGDGGDSLRVGLGSIWLTNLKAGTVSRILLTDVPKDCLPARATRR